MSIEPATPEAKPVEPQKKDKAPKAPKVISPEKILETLIKNYFLTPFARRLRYLYSGVGQYDESYFVMGSVAEDKLSFGDPNQSLALINLKTDSEVRLIRDWLDSVGLYRHIQELIDLPALALMFSKVKWDSSQISARRTTKGVLLVKAGDEEESVSDPIESFFSLTKIERMSQIYDHVAFHNTTACYEYPYTSQPLQNLNLIHIPRQMFKDSSIGDLFTSDIKFVAIKGMDLLDTKVLEAKAVAGFIGFKFWIPSGSSLLYMHCFENPHVRIVQARCHVFLVPRRDNARSREL